MKKNLPILLFCLAFSPIFAQKKSEKAIKLEENFVAAHNFFLLEKYDKAAEAFKAVIEEDPKNDVAWYESARTWAMLNDHTKSLDAARKATELDPENQWYASFEGELLEKMGRYKEAAEVFSKLNKRLPKDPDFLEKNAYLLLLSGDANSALKALDRLEKLVGVTENASRQKHSIYAKMGDVKKATAELEKLVAAEPAEIQYRHQLAQYLERVGETARAKAIYQQILAKNPDDAIAKLAVVEATGGSELTRIAALKPLFADEKQPIDIKIKELLAFLPQIDAGTDKPLIDAVLDLATSLEVAHADDPKAFSISGDLFYHANRPDEALARYEKCIALRGNVFPVWENMMTILKEKKDWPRLLTTADKALEWFPNQAKVRLFRGIALNETGRPDEAVADLEQAVIMSGNNLPLKSDAYDCLGLVFYKKKDWATARQKWESGLAKCGEINPFLLDHLGDALAQMGEADAAVGFWQKAKAKGLKSPRLDQKIAERKVE